MIVRSPVRGFKFAFGPLPRGDGAGPGDGGSIILFSLLSASLSLSPRVPAGLWVSVFFFLSKKDLRARILPPGHPVTRTRRFIWAFVSIKKTAFITGRSTSRSLDFGRTRGAVSRYQS